MKIRKIDENTDEWTLFPSDLKGIKLVGEFKK